MDAGIPSAEPAAPFVTVGAARLPRSVAGELSSPLIVELTLDCDGKRIVEVATSMSLPGFTALLRKLLIGTRVDQLEAAIQRISRHYRGPLLRPTIAALRNAAANNGGDVEAFT